MRHYNQFVRDNVVHLKEKLVLLLNAHEDRRSLRPDDVLHIYNECLDIMLDPNGARLHMSRIMEDAIVRILCSSSLVHATRTPSDGVPDGGYVGFAYEDHVAPKTEFLSFFEPVTYHHKRTRLIEQQRELSPTEIRLKWVGLNCHRLEDLVLVWCNSDAGMCIPFEDAVYVI